MFIVERTHMLINYEWRAFLSNPDSKVVDVRVVENPARFELLLATDKTYYETPRSFDLAEKYLIKFDDTNDDFPDATIYGPYATIGTKSGVVWLHKVGQTIQISGPTHLLEPEYVDFP
jgi:hypothetical protein